MRGGPLDPDVEPRVARSRSAVVTSVALGGVLGASARYGIARLVPAHAGTFPWATFWTNVSGSFVLGALVVGVLHRLPPGHLARPLVATGVIGAFTTMSSFAVEADLLVRAGRPATATGYVLASTAAGLAAAALGVVVGRGRR